MFNLFKHSGETRVSLSAPAAVSIPHACENVLYAPVSGKVMDLESVPDPAFSSGALGQGVAIEPAGACIYAPVSGTVAALFPTGHALGISASNGASVMVHVGIDTVKLEGKGFEPLVCAGCAVNAGDPLINIDLPSIRRSYPATVMAVVENSADFRLNRLTSGDVSAGDPLLEMENGQ